ncbi:hypothetical protein M0805_009383 [Coniferiporia weirii]|nr:hypothetical protein M0805_009383 [Coniferiporia weirii]
MIFSALYSSLSFLSSGLVISLLPWYSLHKNVPGLFTIVWLFTVNLLFGLNATVLKNMLLRKPVYCDIVTKLLLGMQMAVPIAMFCYSLSIRSWIVHPQGRGYMKLPVSQGILYATLCIFVPLAYMILHYAVQGHRFDIVEDVGCFPSVSNSAIGWAIIWGIPMLPFCGVSVIATLTFKHICAQNWNISGKHMPFKMSDSGPPAIQRIRRLGVMICVVMLWTLALPYYAISVFAHSDSFVFAGRPDVIHISVFASLSRASTSVVAIKPFLWTGPVYSLLFFAASVDKDMLLSYPSLFKKLIFRRRTTSKSSGSVVDLSTLAPAPIHQRIYEQVTHASQQYNSSLPFIDYDTPPTDPADPETLTSAPPVPQLSILEAAHIYPEEEGEEQPVQQRPRKGSREFRKAMRRHDKTRDNRPLYTIPEEPLRWDDTGSIQYGYGASVSSSPGEGVFDMV